MVSTTVAPSSSNATAEEEEGRKGEEERQAQEEKPKQVYGSIPEYQQCGGNAWAGSGHCAFGLECVWQSDWYSQCSKQRAIPSPGEQQQYIEPTLFCFSVVTPGTSEPGLMMQQWHLRAGLFTCDAHTIISNVSQWALFPDKDMASKVAVSIIKENLWGPVGWGPHGHSHVLNTPIFTKAWQRIIDDGVYKKYHWTLKLDVDAVIVPPRVKGLLSSKPKDGDHYAPVYILNVVQDAVGNYLHGPVECLSRAAVDAYSSGAGRCQKEVDSSLKGEDWYMNACLELLQVPGVQDLQLLQDAYAWGAKQVECVTSHGVFHPCKDNWRWTHCVQEIGPDATVSPQAQWMSDKQAFVLKYGTRGAAAVSGGVGEWRGATGGVALTALLCSLALLAVFVTVLQRRGSWRHRVLDALRTRLSPSYNDLRRCHLEANSASSVIE